LLALMLGSKVAQGLATSTYSPTGTARVAIVRTEGQLVSAVRQAVALAGGLTAVIAPGDVVVIKPNMVMDASASSGMVTDPAVTRVVVQLAREAGAGQVIIAEGTAQYGEGDPNRDRFCTRSAFRNAGYDADEDMTDDITGAPLVDLNDSGGTDVTDPAKVTRVVVPAGLMRTEYWLPNVVLNADVLISVPVLKNHYNAGVTLGMKNLFGVLPNDLYHGAGNIYGKHSLSHNPVELDRHIVDVNLARRPDFVIVDGQRGMIDGPVGSQIAAPPVGIILAGRDVVAADTVGALVMGYDPNAIPYLNLAAQAGLGTTNTGHIQVAGVPLTEARRDFPAPYAGSAGQRADAQPPVGAITVTPEGEPPAPITVTVEASDNVGVSRVELYLDGQWVGQVLSAPYHFSLDLSKHSPGSHRLRAMIYDRSLNQTMTGYEISLAAPATSPRTLQPTATLPPPTSSPVPPDTATAVSPSPPPTVTATPSPATTEVCSPVPIASVTVATPKATPGPSPEATTRTTAPLASLALIWISHQVIVMAAGGILGLLIGLVIWKRRRQ
jgi:uncharacterized protein (DUF362 family)